MEQMDIRFEIESGIATITINRPTVLNALNTEVITGLETVLHKLMGDPSLRVVILTGAGKKSFVAGADIGEMVGLSTCAAHEFALKGQRVMQLLSRLGKPVIAAVNGYALGGGLELALACDFMYAADNARFGFPEVGLGIMPGFGGTQNLARRIGSSRASELIFTGRTIGAATAKEWGIVNEVVPAEELLARVVVTAREIASKGVLGVATAKHAIVNGLNMGKEEGFRYEASLFSMLFATEDQREGMAAFQGKRRAEFVGK